MVDGIDLLFLGSISKAALNDLANPVDLPTLAAKPEPASSGVGRFAQPATLSVCQAHEGAAAAGAGEGSPA